MRFQIEPSGSCLLTFVSIILLKNKVRMFHESKYKPPMNIFSLRDYYSEPLVTDKYNPKTISIRVVFEISGQKLYCVLTRSSKFML